MHLAALSLGSNQAPVQHLSAAVTALRQHFPGALISPAYRFAAVGFDGPDFVNAAAVIETGFDPWSLTTWLRALEDQHGRERNGPRFGNRTLDIDIVLFDQLILDPGSGLNIPRDELRHAFVLKPLADIAAHFQHPQQPYTIGQLWRQHPQHAEVFARVEI